MIGTYSKTETDFDVVIVGAGFAGMYMLHSLRCLGFSVCVIESGDGVGGTWYWNQYPGARCDTESMYYSYQFSEELQQEWDWSELYPGQSEILSYANHVANKFNLYRNIRFKKHVTACYWDDNKRFWTVETDPGQSLRATFCVMATGCLSSPNFPAIPGLSTFEGDVLHTAEWPSQNTNFVGKSVAVIGTGSSAIQIIPEIAKIAKHLFVFQRTANYIVPANNRPLKTTEIEHIKANYPALRNKAKSTAKAAASEAKSIKKEENVERREAVKDKKVPNGNALLLSKPLNSERIIQNNKAINAEQNIINNILIILPIHSPITSNN